MGSRPYADRKTLLAILGSLTVAYAALVFLGGMTYAVLFPILMRTMPTEVSGAYGAPFSNSMMFGYGLVMFGYGAALLAVGIGLIRARRWARAMAHAGCWICAVGIAAGLIYLPFLIPRLTSVITDPAFGGGEMAEGDATLVAAMMWGSTVISVLMSLVIPVAGIVLLGSDSVRRTVFDRDPIPRWTDRLSTVALACGIVWLWGASYVPMMLPVLGSGLTVAIPVANTPAAVALALLGAAIAASIGWVTLRAQPFAWLANLAGVILAGTIASIQLSRIDLVELYLEMVASSIPESELGPMREMLEALYGDTRMLVVPVVLFAMLAVGFLFWARGRFVRKSTVP